MDKLLRLYWQLTTLRSQDPTCLDFLSPEELAQLEKMLGSVQKVADSPNGSKIIQDLEATKVGIGAKGARKAPQTLGDLMNAATELERLWVKEGGKQIFNDIVAQLEAGTLKAYFSNTSISDIQKIEQLVADIIVAAHNIDKSEHLNGQVPLSDVMWVSKMINAKRLVIFAATKDGKKQYELVKEGLSLTLSSVLMNKSKDDYMLTYGNNKTLWEKQILVRMATLDTTPADVNQVQTWLDLLNLYIKSANAYINAYGALTMPEDIQNYNNITSNAQPEMVKKLAEVQTAFTRSQEKLVDIANPPAMPERDAIGATNKNIQIQNFAQTPLFAKGQGENLISPNDIQQGALDDCGVVSTLAALAQISPKTISNNIKPNGKGGFVVQLYVRDPQTLKLVPHTETVTPDFYADAQGNLLYANNGGGESELWGQIYEKAIAQARGGYDGIDINDSRQMASMITGRESQTYDMVKAVALFSATDKVAKKTLQNSVILVNTLDGVSTQTKINAQIHFKVTNATNTTVLGLVDKHSYRFVSANAAAQTIIISNPKTNQELEISFTQLQTYFKDVVTN